MSGPTQQRRGGSAARRAARRGDLDRPPRAVRRVAVRAPVRRSRLRRRLPYTQAGVVGVRAITEHQSPGCARRVQAGALKEAGGDKLASAATAPSTPVSNVRSAASPARHPRRPTGKQIVVRPHDRRHRPHPPRHHPAARRSTSSTPPGTATRCSPAWATGCTRDFPTINWTADQLAKGIFYHARELNEAFTSVFT